MLHDPIIVSDNLLAVRALNANSLSPSFINILNGGHGKWRSGCYRYSGGRVGRCIRIGAPNCPDFTAGNWAASSLRVLEKEVHVCKCVGGWRGCQVGNVGVGGRRA